MRRPSKPAEAVEVATEPHLEVVESVEPCLEVVELRLPGPWASSGVLPDVAKAIGSRALSWSSCAYLHDGRAAALIAVQGHCQPPPPCASSCVPPDVANLRRPRSRIGKGSAIRSGLTQAILGLSRPESLIRWNLAAARG